MANAPPVPVVLDRTSMPECHLHHDIGTKSPDLEAPFGIGFPVNRWSPSSVHGQW
jgi:hypothetical protein